MAHQRSEAMDAPRKFWYYPAMSAPPIPSWQLYGENTAFPDILHVEQIVDRAAVHGWTIAPHRHQHLHQLFLLSSGTVQLTIDGERQSIVPPAIVNVPRGCVHGFVFSAGAEGFVVTLPADDFPDLFAASAETADALARMFSLTADAALSRRFRALAEAHAGSSAFRRTLLRAETAALVALVLEKAQEARGHPITIDPRIRHFADLVRERLAQPFNLEHLAQSLALSPRHLGRLCRAQTGLSAQRYVEAQKMREACRLLVYTRMTAEQIAFSLGYDDPSYFSRVFQRNLRLPPSAYRRRFEH